MEELQKRLIKNRNGLRKLQDMPESDGRDAKIKLIKEVIYNIEKQLKDQQ